MNYNKSENSLGGILDKLGNSLTTISPNKEHKHAKVRGKGSVMNKEKLDHWATRKLITLSIIFQLIEVAKKKHDDKMLKAYWLSYHCLSKMISMEGKVFAKYCGYRHCLICNGIRKAKLINKYFPVLTTWQNPYFVTLTVKSCYAKGLSERIDELRKVISKIVNKYEQRAQRGQGKKLKGIMSIESNFNPLQKTYNLHIHLIVESLETAEILREEWKSYWKQKGQRFVSEKAQDITCIPDLQQKLVELIKYTSKVFIDPTVKKKGDKYDSPMIYISAMHNIFSAMKRRHAFSSFGFILPKKNKEKNEEIILKKPARLIYDLTLANWIDEETQELFSHFVIPNRLKAILENNINVQKE